MKIIALLMQPTTDSPNDDKMQFMTENLLFTLRHDNTDTHPHEHIPLLPLSGMSVKETLSFSSPLLY